MSNTLSNLYVEKVNSEHPLALWMLNEQVDYLSLINDTNREIENASEWVIVNATATTESNPPSTTPILDSGVSKIAGSVPTGLTMTIEAKSLYTFPISSFTQDLASVAIGLHVYVENPYTTLISYGYEYYDPTSALTIQKLSYQDIQDSDSGSWLFLSNTLDCPPIDATNIKLIIKIDTASGGSVGDYNFLINGLTFGQWSEEFNRTSLGVNPVPIPSNIALPSSMNVVPAYPYGSSNLNAYYIAHEYRLYAKNFGIPLVYGSSNVSKIYPHQHLVGEVLEIYPAIIFPGYGFLNKSGVYNEYTAEMWVRLNTDAVEPRKFFGPIVGNDGIYVEGGFLTLVLGKKYASHYVGEWMRPMLIHVKYSRKNISMLLNGEEVISLDYSESDIDFPTEYNGSDQSQDWLGFYAYEDVHPIDIDSFVIYPYLVPTIVAKRRWVWGQGVTAPEIGNSSTNSTTVYNDYTFANYASNYNYPDFANWKQGFFSNVETSSSILSLPSYSLPTFNLGTKTIQDLYDENISDNSDVDGHNYLTLRPNSSWDSEDTSIYFDKLGILNEPVESFYGVFKTDGTAAYETLFKIENKNTKDSIVAKVNESTVIYTSIISGVSTNIANKTITPNQKFIAGINIALMSLRNIDGINKFFANQTDLSVTIGRDTDLYSVFTGKIYKVGFNAAYNNSKINSLYDSSDSSLSTYGIFSSTYTDAGTLFDHVANYTLTPITKYGTYFMDISVAGYWEDYMPLSYFAKSVYDEYEKTTSYDLDSIQFNLDFPEPLEISSTESTGSWTYGDLYSSYSYPVDLSYEDLANNFFTGWEDYQDMRENSEKYFYYNTDKSSIRSYVSFQNISDGANNNLTSFANLEVPRTNGLVDPENTPGDWEDTAYEVVDGSIIYPPKTNLSNKSIDFNNLAIVYHLDFKAEGILHHPIKVRDLQLASQVLEKSKFTEIGTKFGVPIYPYNKTGLYYNFKGQNPISTYKGSTPYLYLNRHSGWRIRGDFNPIIDRGLAIPINTQKALDIKVGSLQLWLRFSEKTFPTQELKIFSIDHKDGIYDFYMVADQSTQRGKVYAKDRSTDLILTSLEYHVNGNFVDTPYLVNEEWTVLGIAFTGLINFEGYTGRINLNGPLTYNNISYQLSSSLEQKQSVNLRSWQQVKEDGIALSWDVWKTGFTWEQVYVVETSNYYAIDPSATYNKYVGTDRFIVDDEVNGIMIDPEKIKVYKDVVWSTSTNIPV